MSIKKSAWGRSIVFGVSCIVLAPVGIGPASAQSSGITKPFKMEGAQVSLPPAVTASKKDGPDFLIYYFTLKAKKERQILFAYVGNFPSFPGEVPKNIKEKPVKMNGRKTRTFLWKDKKGGVCRETLVEGEQKSFPAFVHFIYAGLSADEAKTVDGIIGSMRFGS